jgi:ubiquinone/menaquinone biosynthesis C-methylase UbiE
MSNQKTYISWGDLVDLYYKLREKGFVQLTEKLHFSESKRSKSKWNNEVSSSHFWDIPAVLKRWNEKISGDPDLEYETYFTQKYLSSKKGLHLLSIGCGNGNRERRFASFPNFETIEGIDFASKQITEAKKIAHAEKLNHLTYHTGDFLHFPLKKKSYDVILFNSSLHHFKNIETLLTKRVIPLLKDDGFLVIFEYVGPDRLQWKKEQLNVSNQVLKNIPPPYRKRYRSNTIKKNIYRPGLLRMFLNDPSEAPASSTILNAIHKHFKIIEEKKVGWDITHLVFKDIAHHFLGDDPKTKELLEYVFQKEDEYLQHPGTCDAVFGIYQPLYEDSSLM